MFAVVFNLTISIHMITKFYFTIFALFFSSLSLPASQEHSAVTETVRDQAANDHLQKQTNRIAIYAKGFVCNSCGVGLRIHIGKLPLVDKSQFDKGLLMDAAKQLLIVGIHTEGAFNNEALKRTIEKAGYESEYYYRWDGEKTLRHYFD